jgi:hypothetical protein
VQVADNLARDEGIVAEAALRVAAGVAAGAEDVEAVALDGCAVIDRRFDVEERLIHLELAEVSRPVAEPFQHRSHIGQVRVEARRVRVLHLIEDVMNLRWLPGEERCAGRRTHGRGDVMVAECDAVAGNRIEGRQRIVRPGQQPVSVLVVDHEEDVVGQPASGVRASRLAFLSVRNATLENHQAHACQQAQAVVE